MHSESGVITKRLSGIKTSKVDHHAYFNMRAFVLCSCAYTGIERVDLNQGMIRSVYLVDIAIGSRLSQLASTSFTPTTFATVLWTMTVQKLAEKR